MRAFVIAVAAVILLALGANIGLHSIQKSSADAYTTGSARLDQQESVDFYGRSVTG
jgi:hypothetical protein